MNRQNMIEIATRNVWDFATPLERLVMRDMVNFPDDMLDVHHAQEIVDAIRATYSRMVELFTFGEADYRTVAVTAEFPIRVECYGLKLTGQYVAPLTEGEGSLERALDHGPKISLAGMVPSCGSFHMAGVEREGLPVIGPASDIGVRERDG